MNIIIILLLIGFASGIIIFPIGLWITNLIRNTLERRRVKKLIKQDKFLVTIDPKDYDSSAWTNQSYGNIDINANKKDLINLSKKIFTKSPENADNDFQEKIKEYVREARKAGFNDRQITEKFKEKNYSDEFIMEVLNNG